MGYYEAQVMQSFAGLLVFLVLVLVIATMFSESKTRKYRKKIVDLFVAAKTRALAKKDDLDLNEEFGNFLVSEKNDRKLMREYRLDQVIEDDLMDSVSKPSEKK